MTDLRHDRSTLLAALLQLMPRWGPLDVGPFEHLSGGYSNDNYLVTVRGARYVFRRPFRTPPFIDRTTEARFYEGTGEGNAEGSEGPRVPEVVAFDQTTGSMLSRFEAGELLADTTVPVARVLSYLKNLHPAVPDNGRSYDPLERARHYLSTGRPPGWILALAGEPWEPAHLTPCHNDLNPWNVLIPPVGRWLTLDWEWHGSNDPMFDLVSLHQGLELAGRIEPDNEPLLDWANDWLGEPVDPGRLQQNLEAYWLREYAWAHAEIEHGNRREEIEGQKTLAEARLRGLR